MITLEEVKDVHRAVEAADQLTGTQGIIAAGKLRDRVHRVSAAWVEITRARLTADEHYLGGKSMRTIAGDCDMSVNAIHLWLKNYGPTKYVTVREETGHEGRTRFVVEAVEPGAAGTTLRYLRDAGRRVAPARMGLYDNDTGIVGGVQAEQLWHELAAQS